jgi:hypothetical protein
MIGICVSSHMVISLSMKRRSLTFQIPEDWEAGHLLGGVRDRYLVPPTLRVQQRTPAL